MDLAANHAVRISNTYVMDRCLGWRGLCIEANEVCTFPKRKNSFLTTCQFLFSNPLLLPYSAKNPILGFLVYPN